MFQWRVSFLCLLAILIHPHLAQAASFQGLGYLPGGGFSEARAISADGSTIVGYGTIASGFEAFRWTSATGMVGLGDLPGGVFQSYANAISADGSTIVGYGLSASGYEAFRWTSATGMVGLGDLTGGNFQSEAYAISADGSTIVGRGTSASGVEAFIWDATNGMRSLQEVLISYGVDLTGWKLTNATSISSDGKFVVGYGTNPNGDTEAWIADITPPWGATIPGLGTAPLTLDFQLKAYQESAAVSVTSADLINLIADTMGKPRPPKGTKLALHTLGPNAGKAYLVDAKANPLAGFDPIDKAIFSIESSDFVATPPGGTPGTYKKTAYFQVNFALNFTGNTKMKFGGVASVKTNYTDATAKGSATGKLTLGGAGQLAGKRAVLAGRGKSSQKK